MDLLQIIEQLNPDWSTTFIELGCSTWLGFNSEFSPKLFLNFAKDDYKANDERGLANALSNAKRAIDCQIDKLISCIGFNYASLPRMVHEFIRDHEVKEGKTNATIKLKLIQALGLAPSGLISEVRTLRNKLEHYYKIPKRKEVGAAIELSELFIGCTESKLRMFPCEFDIFWQDNLSNEDNEKEKDFIGFMYDDKKNNYRIYSLGKSFELTSNTKPYLELMRLSFAFDDPQAAKNALIGVLASMHYKLLDINIDFV